MDRSNPTTEHLNRQLERTGVGARAISMPTPWQIGDVTAYLFGSDPVTMIDAGVNTPEAWEVLVAGLAQEGLRPADVRRVIVTHAHTDHFGGAALLQEAGGCEVLLHPADIAICAPEDWPATNRELFLPLGYSEEMVDALWGDDEGAFEWRVPAFTPVGDGETFGCGDARLRVEHHPGHSPGHLWVVDDVTGTIFVGDYILEHHPTNAGLEIDRSHPTGRAQLLQAYNAGLLELMGRPAPALYPGHGPPIIGHHGLIERRLAKTGRRTAHVAAALTRDRRSALGVARTLYGDRAERSWEMMSDLVGRLDLLVAEERASATLGEDGVWYFAANDDAPTGASGN